MDGDDLNCTDRNDIGDNNIVTDDGNSNENENENEIENYNSSDCFDEILKGNDTVINNCEKNWRRSSANSDDVTVDASRGSDRNESDDERDSYASHDTEMESGENNHSMRQQSDKSDKKQR